MIIYPDKKKSMLCPDYGREVSMMICLTLIRYVPGMCPGLSRELVGLEVHGKCSDNIM